MSLADDTNPVMVYSMENPHVEDYVITYVPEAGVVFVVDLYNPDPSASSLPAGAQLLRDKISELDLDVSVIAGGHGGTIAFAVFEDLPGQ